jgi:predicted nucleic acid-binding protein
MLADTGFLIDVLRESRRGTEGPATRLLSRIGPSRIAIPLFVLCEVRAGVLRAPRPAEEQLLIERIVKATDVSYPQAGFDVLYAETEAILRNQGTPIPLMDLLIGVLAKAAGEPLITRDARHFSKIPGLSVETY